MVHRTALDRSGTTSWSIGELAAESGVTVRALRHYDELGLLRPATRTKSDHRRYGPAEVERLFRLIAWRDLGFSLDQLPELLDAPNTTSTLELARRQLAAVEADLDARAARRTRLRHLVADVLLRVQHQLFGLGADVSVPELDEPARRVTDQDLDWLEQIAADVSDSLGDLDSFVLPGGGAPERLWDPAHR
ncbi:MAG: MerR family transcriptional regulator [Microthrixaceae bacterium]